MCPFGSVLGQDRGGPALIPAHPTKRIIKRLSMMVRTLKKLTLVSAAALLSATALHAVPDQATGKEPFDQEGALAKLRKSIAGRESQPSSEVFKKIEILKDVPAGGLLKIMELGFSKSLGVNCRHCHVVGEWDKEDNKKKQVAREMWKMVKAINEEYLKNIKNLESEKPIVNCTTCHRGQIKPALQMPESKPRH
jgi:hypothetical protein